jgi:hypothetical protein
MTENNPLILPNIYNVSIKNDDISLDIDIEKEKEKEKEKEIKLVNEKLKLLDENRKLIDRINKLKSNIIYLEEMDKYDDSDDSDSDDSNAEDSDAKNSDAENSDKDSNKELNESEEKELIPEKYNLDPSKDDNLLLVDRIEELKINIIKLQDKLGLQICEFFDSCKRIERTADMFCYDNLEDCYWALIEYLGCADPLYKAHDYEYCSKEIFGEESEEEESEEEESEEEESEEEDSDEEESDEEESNEEQIKDIPESLILKTTDNIQNDSISNYVIKTLNKNNIESLFETFDEAYNNYLNKVNEFNLLNNTNLEISSENISKLQDLFGWEICEFFNNCKSFTETTVKYHFDDEFDCYEALVNYFDSPDFRFTATDYDACHKEIFSIKDPLNFPWKSDSERDSEDNDEDVSENN